MDDKMNASRADLSARKKTHSIVLGALVPHVCGRISMV